MASILEIMYDGLFIERYGACSPLFEADFSATSPSGSYKHLR
jgi:hypothetical protein